MIKIVHPVPEHIKIHTDSYQLDESYLHPQTEEIELIHLLESVLKTSGNHAKVIDCYLNQGFIQKDESWVITQYEIDIHALPQLGDQIQIETRIIDANRFFVTRRFEISGANQVYLTIYIQFVVLNLLTRTMGQADISILKATGLVDKTIQHRMTSLKQDPNQKIELCNSVEITARDIDKNGHVNNLVYLRWCQAAIASLQLSSYLLRTIKVKYGHELFQDDQITLSTAVKPITMDTIQSYHEISCINRNQLACLVEIAWQA